MDITDHDGDALAVDGTQVDVLKEADQVCLGGLLEGSNGSGLEPQIDLAFLGDLTDKTLEGQLADQQFGALLVTTDLAEGNGAWAEAMRLLDAGGGGRLAGGLGCNLFAGSLSTGGFASSLFGACHLSVYGIC